MDDALKLLIPFAIVFAASLVQGATAFGFALVAVPLLLLFFPATETVVISLFIGTALNLLMIRVERNQVIWREILPFMPAVASGAVAGMLLLKTFEGPLFNALIALAVLAMALMMLAHRSWKVRPGQKLGHAVGSFSGILFGATSMGGPPMVLYLTGRGLTKEKLRGTLAVFFLLGNLLTLGAFAARGMLDGGDALTSALLIGAVVPGGLTGRALTARLNHQAFRTLVLASMCSLAVLVIAINLRSL